ncbi:hypothetical protein ACFL4Y_04425, partial [Gemmatimonadota bacterium]
MEKTTPEELEFPKVREDISYTPMVLRGRSVWVVKDPVRRKFIQFDDLSKRLCELCDGTRTLHDLKVQMEKDFTEFEFTEEYLKTHIAHFRKLKLVLRDRFEYNVLLIERERRDREKRNNILHMRFPAFNPDASLEWLLQRVRWVFSRPFVIFYLIVVIGSYLILLLELPETMDGLAGFYAFPGWKAQHILALYVTIIAIIVMHEYGHGLSCKYFGGEVPAMGILIIYVINPALYCNVSDSYRFPKKSSRIWVMAGGAVVEFFIGAIAVFVWWLTDPSLLIHSFAFKIVIFCSITSILFNMNPLLKYDGYYILAEYLEIPNLRKRSFQYLGWIIRSKVFGLAGKRPSAEGRERLVFFAYAVAATVYSIMIFSLIFTLLKNWLVGSLEGLGWILTFLLMYLILRKIILKGTGALRMAVLDRTGAVRRH